MMTIRAIALLALAVLSTCFAVAADLRPLVPFSRTAGPVDRAYLQTLTKAQCITLLCSAVATDDRVRTAGMDYILYRPDGPRLAAQPLKYVSATFPIGGPLRGVATRVADKDLKGAASLLTAELKSPASALVDPHLTQTDVTALFTILDTVARTGKASAADVQLLTGLSTSRGDSKAPRFALAVALLSMQRSKDALSVTYTIPYQQPITPYIYSDADGVAIQLARAIDPNAFALPPRPSH